MPKDTLRSWSFQPRSVLETLRREGRVFVDERLVSEGSPPFAHRWLAEQLAQRAPGYGGRLPWWLHTAFKSSWSKSPPAERARNAEVLLEFECDRSRVCTIPSWAWEQVFLGRYLALSHADELCWRRDLRRAGVARDAGGTWLDAQPIPLPEPFETRRRRSYERLFDPTLPARRWPKSNRHGHASRRGMEALVEALELDCSRRVVQSTESKANA